MKIKLRRQTSLDSLSSYIIILIKFSIYTALGILANIYSSGLSSYLVYEKKGIIEAKPVVDVVLMFHLAVPKCFSLNKRDTSRTSSEAITLFMKVVVSFNPSRN